MSALSEKLIGILTGKFNLDLLEKIKFWEKPLSLQLLNKSTLEQIQNFLGELILDLGDFDLNSLSKIKAILKKNPETNELLSRADNSLEDEILSDLLTRCQNISNETSNEVTTELNNLKYDGNFLENIQKVNDLANKVISEAGKYKDMAIEYASLALMVFYIGKLIIDTFTQSDFPSKFRLKYIQRLIRITLSTIWNDEDENTQKLKRFLVIADAIVIAVGIASAVYLHNLLKTQGEAEAELNENLCPELEDQLNNLNAEASGDVETEVLGNNFDLVCAVDEDDVIVPHVPYNEILECLLENEDQLKELQASLAQEIAVKAIIENKREEKWKYTVTVDSQVTDQTIIATLEGHSVYAPTGGYIVSLHDASIVLGDISDPPEDYLTQNIKALNEKYTELNYLKDFIKKWEVISLYPIMIQKSKDGKAILGGGIGKEFQQIKDVWGLVYGSYEKKVKEITGEDNIKEKGDNDELYLIKEELDAAEAEVTKYLKTVEIDAINIAKKNKPKKGEFELIEYYLFELSLELNAIKEPNEYEKTYRDHINVFTEQRYILDGFKPDKIKDKIKELLGDLEKGLTNKEKFFEKGVEKYNKRKRMKDVKDWLETIKNPKKLEVTERQKLINQILYLYEFYFSIGKFISKYEPDPSTGQVDPSINKIEADNKQQVIEEGNYISNFFGNLWKRYNALPKEIAKIEAIIEDLSIYSPYTLTGSPGDQSRLYIIAPETAACKPEGGFTEADMGNIRYWIKYCTFATLASVANPATGWSTGLILPTGPLLLPTVYIPIVPIPTQYGFIVLGLTITGLWIFPMILMVNYSTEYAMPILDPTAFLRKQLEELKKEINEQLKNFKESKLTKYLEEKKVELEAKTAEADAKIEEIKAHKLNRPTNTVKNEEETTAWTQVKDELQIPLDSLNLQKYNIEKQWQVVNDVVQSGGKLASGAVADVGLLAIETTEALIEQQFEKLNGIIDELNILVAPLPTTLQPNTANFGFTLKKPVFVINIADELDDNINPKPLKTITDQFKISNESFMTGIGTKFDYKNYLTALNVAKLLPSPAGTIKKDPFPSYENLKVTNLQWVKFLATEFVTTGAKTYGIPGQLPPASP